MKTVNALSLRQSLGKVLKQLDKNGSPIFVERNRKRVAALVSIADFNERFADRDAAIEREELVEGILKFRSRQAKQGPSAVSILRDLRNRDE